MPRITTSSMREAADRGEDPSAADTSRQPQPAEKPPSQDFNTLKVVDTIGDLFGAPANSVLIHACNSQGSWGAGIAAAFKTRYPRAYKMYRNHCQSSEGNLLGSALLIPPMGDAQDHYIGCLFTSENFGKRKGSPSNILGQTKPAMLDLLEQVFEESQKKPVLELRMCQINSGLFAVPWEDTKQVLEDIECKPGMLDVVTVFSLE